MQFLEHKVIFILVQPDTLCYAVSMKMMQCCGISLIRWYLSSGSGSSSGLNTLRSITELSLAAGGETAFARRASVGVTNHP